MDLGINGFLGRIKEHYDKVIAFAILLALVASLLTLWLVKLPQLNTAEKKFESWRTKLSPSNPAAAIVDAAFFEGARRALEAPLQLAVPSEGQADAVWMFVPEARFNCRECRHPVAAGAEICPFCNASVVETTPEPLDHDGDGMPTEWERRYGLDPFDPTDAHKDLDGDGWTNLEEYLAGTDPTDPESRPPAIGRVVLESITGTRFDLRYNSRVRTSSGHKFGLNYRLPSGETRTEFVSIEDTIEGFKVMGHELKEEPPKPPVMVKVDVSELTLLTPRGDEIILIKDQDRLHVELEATLSLTLGANVQTFKVRKGDPLEVDGRTYSVIGVDAKDQIVILRGEDTNSVITIRKGPIAAAR